jgi:hypothetical protein
MLRPSRGRPSCQRSQQVSLFARAACNRTHNTAVTSNIDAKFVGFYLDSKDPLAITFT